MPSQVTITGTIQDISGTNLVSGTNSAYVRFILRNFQGSVPLVSGTSIVAETQIDSAPSAGGALSQLLWPNNALTPANTFYTVQFWSQGRITSQGNYIFNANTNINTAAQLNPAPTPTLSPIIFENNGVLNSSQTTLNLVGSGLTDLGGGSIQIPTGSAFSTAGQDFFFGPGITAPAYLIPYGGSGQLLTPTGSGVGNVVVVWKFSLQSSWTLRKCHYVTFSSNSANTVDFGIYSATGNLLLDAGSFSVAAGVQDTVQTNTLPTTTLSPGTYYFAQTYSYSGGGWQGTSGPITVGNPYSSTQAADFFSLMNSATAPQAAIAANLASGGLLPATLGTLTPITNGALGVGLPLWTP